MSGGFLREGGKGARRASRREYSNVNIIDSLGEAEGLSQIILLYEYLTDIIKVFTIIIIIP